MELIKKIYSTVDVSFISSTLPAPKSIYLQFQYWSLKKAIFPSRLSIGFWSEAGLALISALKKRHT
jgi:hypothetical protein